MMRLKLILVLSLIGVSAADAFEARFASAKRTLAQKSNAAIAAWLGPEVMMLSTSFIRKCASELQDPSPEGFILLGDIDAMGEIHNIAVRPETNLASCMRSKMSMVHLQPPKFPTRLRTLPILFDSIHTVELPAPPFDS